MLTNFDRVKDFHTSFNVDQFTGSYSQLLELMVRRHKMLREEFLEGEDALLSVIFNASHVTEEIYREMIRGTIDSLLDVLYVAYGTLELLGVDANAAFQEVHGSNMSKLDSYGKPIKDPTTGKIKKGPNYQPPVLDKHVDAVLERVHK